MLAVGLVHGKWITKQAVFLAQRNVTSYIVYTCERKLYVGRGFGYISNIYDLNDLLFVRI